MTTRRVIEGVLGHPLSDEQWSAVSSPAEPAAIIAGAGSGKTTVMSARVLWLVVEGFALPDEVLGLTFTTKAAGELLGRTRRLIGEASRRGLVPDASDDLSLEPAISTYHSFASRLLADHGVRLGLEPHATVLADGARQVLAARVIRATSLPLASLGQSPSTLVSAVLSLDDSLAELDISPGTVLDDAVDLVDWLDALPQRQRIADSMLATARVRAALCGLVEEFRAAKLAEQSVDFADQVRLGLEIVRAAPDVASDLRERFPFVLLDEYQDTSSAQRILLQEIFAGGHPVTAVGDPCQAIYEWRGASVDNIDRFPEHFPRRGAHGTEPAVRYPLADNRRSAPRIVDLANEVAAPLRAIHAGVEPLRAAAEGRGSGEIVVGLHQTYVDEVTWVCDRIGDLGRREGAWGGITVLARTGDVLVDIDRQLRARGIPSRLLGIAGLLDVPVVAETRAMLEVLTDPGADASLLRLLAGPRWRIGLRDLAALGALVDDAGPRNDRPADVASALRAAVFGSDPSDRASLADAIEAAVARADAGDPPRLVSPEALERLRRFVREVRWLRAHLDEPAVDLIARVVRSSGLGVESGIGDEAADNARALADFREMAARMAQGRTGLPGSAGITAFLARLREAERYDDSPTREEAAGGDAVRLMTSHRAKGLEFPHVIVAGMSEGVFPSARGRERWPTTAAVVPWPLRSDAPPDLVTFPDRSDGPRAKDHDEFIARSRALTLAEERRLAYVAITRAERSLTVSGHWWGPSQVRPRGPGVFLEEVRDWCDAGGGHVAVWAPEPADDEANPLLDDRAFVWPTAADAVRQARLREVAAAVHAARGEEHASVAGSLEPAEERIVAGWDAAIGSLLAAAHEARQPLAVPLPADLSASALMRLADDPQAYARDLARPMPRRPHAAARRGTELHRWIEGHYAVQTLFDLEDLDAIDDLDPDPAMAQLREAFRRSPYASRAPLAVEEPFAIALSGRVVRGRIDAAFATPGGGVEIVDWKSGGRAGLGDLQLAIYRCAWSEMTGTPISDIDAAFLIVRTGEIVRPQHLADRAELEGLLSDR